MRIRSSYSGEEWSHRAVERAAIRQRAVLTGDEFAALYRLASLGASLDRAQCQQIANKILTLPADTKDVIELRRLALDMQHYAADLECDNSYIMEFIK